MAYNGYNNGYGDDQMDIDASGPKVTVREARPNDLDFMLAPSLTNFTRSSKTDVISSYKAPPLLWQTPCAESCSPKYLLSASIWLILSRIPRSYPMSSLLTVSASCPSTAKAAKTLNTLATAPTANQIAKTAQCCFDFTRGAQILAQCSYLPATSKSQGKPESVTR